jgi:hypothetical protein
MCKWVHLPDKNSPEHQCPNEGSPYCEEHVRLMEKLLRNYLCGILRSRVLESHRQRKKFTVEHLIGFAIIAGVILGIIHLIREPRQTEAERLKAEWSGW